MAEQIRIRRQVRRFLAYLAGLDNQVMADHLSTRLVSDHLRDLIGDDALPACIDTFRQRFITPGNDVDLANWDTVLRLQLIMIQFMLLGLFEDPVSAPPNATEGEQTSDSDADHQ